MAIFAKVATDTIVVMILNDRPCKHDVLGVDTFVSDEDASTFCWHAAGCIKFLIHYNNLIEVLDAPAWGLDLNCSKDRGRCQLQGTL